MSLCWPANPEPLRNGAAFQDWVLPGALERVRRKLKTAPDGDRQMVEVLGAVLTDGLPAVQAACAEALKEGVHSADVILNILSRRRDPGPPATIMTPEARAGRQGRIAYHLCRMVLVVLDELGYPPPRLRGLAAHPQADRGSFGWGKEAAGLAHVKLRGPARVDCVFVFGLAACNLVRLPKLLSAPSPCIVFHDCRLIGRCRIVAVDILGARLFRPLGARADRRGEIGLGASRASLELAYGYSEVGFTRWTR